MGLADGGGMTGTALWWDGEAQTWEGRRGAMTADGLAAAAALMSANPTVTAAILDRDCRHLRGKGGHYDGRTHAIAVAAGYGVHRALAHELFHSVEAGLPEEEYRRLLAVCAAGLTETTRDQRMWFGYAAAAEPGETAAHLYADWALGQTTAGFRPDGRVEALFRRIRAGEFAGPVESGDG